MGVFRKVRSRVKDVDKMAKEIEMAGVSEDAIETYTKLKKDIKKGAKSRKEIMEDRDIEEKKFAKQTEKIAKIKEEMVKIEEKAGFGSVVKLSRLNFLSKDAKKYRKLAKKLKIAKDEQAVHKDMKKAYEKMLERKEKEIKLSEKDMKKCKKTIRKIWSQSADEIKDAKNNKKETKKQQKSEIKPQEEKTEKEFKEKMTENVIFPGSSINQNTIESLQANLSKSKKIDNELKTAVKGLSPNEFMAFIGSMRTQANEGKEISYEEAKNAATTGENKKFLQRQGIKELEVILAQGKKAKKNESQYGKIMYRFAKGYKEIEEERKEEGQTQTRDDEKTV